MKNQLFYRSMAIDERAVNAETRTLPMTCSSETTEVKRWYGREVLSHHPDHIRMGRPLSLLMNHDRGAIVGPVQNMKVAEGRTMADAMFDDTDEGNLRLKQVQSGSLKGTSMGYMVHKMRELAEGEQWMCANGQVIMGGGADDRTYVAVDWEPLEVSLTPVPADASVGMGREASRSLDGIEIERSAGDMSSPETDTNTEEGGTREMDVKTKEEMEKAVSDALAKREADHRDGLKDIYTRAAAVGQEALAFKLISEGKSEREITSALFEAVAAERGKPGDAGEADRTAEEMKLDGITDDTLMRGLTNPTLVTLD